MSETETKLGDLAKFELVWAELTRLGIERVVVSFSGEGDSGQIDDVVMELPGTEQTPESMDTWARVNELFQAAMIDLGPGEPSVQLKNLIETLTDPLITNAGVDWWNNDGGFGECTWWIADMRIHADISERIVTTNNFEYVFNRHGEEIME